MGVATSPKESVQNFKMTSNSQKRGASAAPLEGHPPAKKQQQPQQPQASDEPSLMTQVGVNCALRASSASSLAVEYASGQPFPHLRLADFVDGAFLESVRAELATLTYHVRANDLFEFFQSDDLKSVDASSHPAVAKLRAAIYSPEFLAAVTAVTGVELNDTVDMSAAIYKKGSYLACHDDHNDARRVAYIIYLVEKDWTAEHGGALDLFSKDADGEHPHDVSHSLVPEWNSFAMFEVTPDSWHRVAEVLAEEKPRMTISGWFHGKPKARPAPAPKLPAHHSRIFRIGEEKEEKFVREESGGAGAEAESKAKEAPEVAPKLIPNALADAAHEEEVPVGAVDLAQWLNPKYLDPFTTRQVKKHFIRHSSYMLRNCFLPGKFDELLKVMHADVDAGAAKLWSRAPCPQKQWYLQCCSERPAKGESESEGEENEKKKKEEKKGEKAQVVAAWRRLFLSPEWGRWLESLTSLAVASGSFEGRRFEQGHYTMCDDTDLQHQTCLDVVLGVSRPTDTWSEEHGGYVCYMADEEELLTVPLEANALFLVMRDSGSMRFVKYVNCRAPEGGRCDLSAEYSLREYENDGEEDEGGSEVEEDEGEDSDVYEIDSENDESTMGYGAQAAMIAGHHMG